MTQIKVSVLVQGQLVREGNEIIEASSTVTMIQADARVIIVDTGSSDKISTLREGLTRAGVNVMDVDTVVNTHLHRDHSGGNEIFPRARFYAHKLESPPAGTTLVSEGLELSRGVELVPTPGHTRGSISVLAAAERMYAVSGDAIPTRANLEQRVPPAIHVDRALALKSMELLARAADVIIPGHDAPFPVPQKGKSNQSHRVVG